MRLTVDHVRRAPQFTNTLQQREIDLRGMGISSLDETVLSHLDDSFDVVNLTSNALTSLEYFPLKDTVTGKDTRLKRVVTLIVHRNQIQKVSTSTCAMALPHVEHFLADRNNFRNVRDLYFLKQWKNLSILSLSANPVWDSNAEGFDIAKLRAFLVFLCPRLKLVNNERVTLSEREEAAAHRSEFKALAASFDGSTSTVGGDGRKIRKRGRENREAQASSPAAAQTAIAAQPGATADTSASTTTVVDDANDDVKRRLAELEKRFESEDLTAEEIDDLERQMNELTIEMNRQAARRRTE